MFKIIVDTDVEQAVINKNIYGHFSEHLGRCIYEGIWVGEDSCIPNTRGIRNDVVAALKNINIPVLRWPGGCFADEYHWKDGIGPKDKRKRMINTHWGGVIENNHFGTNEFLDLCEQLGCEPYICGNVGSGTVQEMQEWVEYVTFDGESPMANLRAENGREKPWTLKFFGVGNENWGCGGNMRPEYYADLYRRYQTYVRNYGKNKIYKIACGANVADYRWTDVMMREAAGHMDGLSIHYYTVPGDSWHNKGSAIEFTEEEWTKTISKAHFMEELIVKHSTIMDRYDPKKRVGMIVDEWGTWYNVESGTNPGFLYQQNTLRDALVAGITLNIFNNHCDRVRMANIAQTINVLQAVILTDSENMILTPTYHVFEMYKAHQDAQLLRTTVVCDNSSEDKSTNNLNVSASKDSQGNILLTICNSDINKTTDIDVQLRGDFVFENLSGRVLCDDKMNAHNTFEKPENLKPVALDNLRKTDKGFTATIMSKSVNAINIRS